MAIGVETGVVLSQDSGKNILGDLYLPEGDTRDRPAVILLFGGGWAMGDRAQQKGYGITLAKAGFVCLAADYRLSGTAKWPAQRDDVRTALTWLRTHTAAYRINPDRIAISGHSSGGHLALMAAAQEKVAAVCAFYPATDLVALCALPDGKASIEGLLGPAPTPAQLNDASPLPQVGAGFAPLLLLTGDADTRVPHDQTLRLYERTKALGNIAELHVFAGQPHAFDMDREMFGAASAVMISFLKRHV